MDHYDRPVLRAAKGRLQLRILFLLSFFSVVIDDHPASTTPHAMGNSWVCHTNDELNAKSATWYPHAIVVGQLMAMSLHTSERCIAAAAIKSHAHIMKHLAPVRTPMKASYSS